MKILYIPILFLFIVSCAGPETPSNTDSSWNGARGEIRGARDSGVARTGPKGGAYIPGQILVKFKDNTSKEAIDKIQQDLPVKTVRIVSHPDLYLMKIMDDSTVESIILKLKEHGIVKYAEPNYIRKIN